MIVLSIITYLIGMCISLVVFTQDAFEFLEEEQETYARYTENEVIVGYLMALVVVLIFTMVWPLTWSLRIYSKFYNQR